MASTCWVLGCSRHSAEAYCTNDHLNMYCTCSGDILGHYEPLRSPMLLGSAGYTTVMMFQTFQTFQDPLLRRADVWCLNWMFFLYAVCCTCRSILDKQLKFSVFYQLVTGSVFVSSAWSSKVELVVWYMQVYVILSIFGNILCIYTCVYIYNIHIYRI